MSAISRPRAAVAGLAFAILGVAGIAGARPASADCIELYVGLTWTNGATTNITPWADGTCIVPTPFGTLSDPSGGGSDNNLPPSPPHPNGYRWSATVVMV
jgi:hypothetical protein